MDDALGALGQQTLAAKEMKDGLDDMMHDKTNRDYISGSEKTNGEDDGGKGYYDGGKDTTDGGKGSTDGGKGCDGGKGNDDGSKSDTDSDDEDGSMSDDSPSSVESSEVISVTASPPPAGSTAD